MSDGSVRRFFGGLLMAVGGLIATLSGLCSLLVVAITLAGASQGSDPFNSILSGLSVVGLTGGVPFLIGAALLVAGRLIMRGAPSKPGT